MLAAHMDEIGLMVKYIDDKGYIRFSKIGGINNQLLMNRTVVIHSQNGDVTGVIGSKPPHITKAEKRNKIVPYDKLFIDIGAKDKEKLKVWFVLETLLHSNVGLKSSQTIW